jgi:molybdopterin converting factor small subunit
MTYRVRLFARFRDLAQADTVEVDLPQGATVGDLRLRLSTLCPSIAALLNRSGVAVDDEFAEDTLALPPNADIALVPPVSGGGGDSG